MNPENNAHDSVAELAKLIKKIKVAMFATFGESGMNARPLYTRDVEFTGELWFFTALDSRKVEELKSDTRVMLTYASGADGAYASIKGQAELVSDRRKIEEMWSETMDSLFFKGGKNDPNLIVLKVICEEAELWESASTAIGRAFKFVKAKVTGNIADLGTHQHIDIAS